MCPGNEAYTYAEKIVTLVHKFDGAADDVQAQLTQDDADVEELLKNDKAIMGGIVAMSKMVTAMNDSMKRLVDELRGETSATTTKDSGTASSSGEQSTTN